MKSINEFKKCTRCGNEIGELKIHVNLNLITYRKKESDIWEKIENADISSNEVLCEDCFNLFATTLNNALNIKDDPNV